MTAAKGERYQKLWEVDTKICNAVVTLRILIQPLVTPIQQ